GSADIWILSFGGGVPSKLILPPTVPVAFDISNVAPPPAGPPPGAGGGAFVSPPPPPQPATSATTRREAQNRRNGLCILGFSKFKVGNSIKGPTNQYIPSHWILLATKKWRSGDRHRILILQNSVSVPRSPPDL